MRVTKKHYNKCSVFAFGFQACKQSWLLTTYQSHAASAHWRPSLVPACRFQLVSPGAGALVLFLCSQGWKWMVHITVMSCYSNSCCQTSLKLLATFAFQYTMCAQEHWAAATQDFVLHTRCGLPTDPTSVLRLQIIESHSGMRLWETASDIKHRWWAVVINRVTFY